MNLSSLFKNNQTLFLLGVLTFVAIYALVISNFILAGGVFTLLIISLFIPSTSSIGNSSKISLDMQRVLKDAANGKLEGRVTHIPANDSTESSFAWALNDVLDQLEAFMRDTATTIENASIGKTYRRTYSSGLHGIFRTTALNLNSAIKSIASGHETKIHGEMSQSFGRLGGGVVEGLIVIQKDLSIASEESEKIVTVAKKV